jgi:integrase/recombinase XerD
MLRELFHRTYPRYEASPHAADLEGFGTWLHARGHAEKTTRWFCRRLYRALQPIASPPGAIYSSEQLRQAFASSPRKGYVGTQRLFRRYLSACGRLVLDAPRETRFALRDQYLERCRELRGHAHATLVYNRWALTDFLSRTLEPHQLPSDLTPQAIDAFFIARGPQLARRTFRHSVQEVRSFLRYAFECGALPRPLHGFELPQAFRFEQPPRALRWSHVEELLASIDCSTAAGARDHAIFHLMAHYGLRPSDVTGLRLESIDWRARTLRVYQSKTRSILLLPLSAGTLQELRRYVDRARPLSKHAELFVSPLTPFAPMGQSGISGRFRVHVRRSGLPVEGSAYALRHTFAMRLLANGVGIKAIGDLMGHHSLASTSAYLRIQTDMLREVALEVPVGGGVQ